MTHDPDIERFFQELRSATSVPDTSELAATPQRIVILSEAEGNVVARHNGSGCVIGEYRRSLSGEIYFHYCNDGNRRWYVNKSLSAFCEAAAIFNKCCELHADDNDTDNEAVFAEIAAQLRSEFEKIEPLGDPKAALWSATIHDTDGGLLTLY